MSATGVVRRDVARRFDDAEEAWVQERAPIARTYVRDDGKVVFYESATAWVSSYTAIPVEDVR